MTPVAPRVHRLAVRARRSLLIGTAAALAAGAVGVLALHRRDMRRAYARIAAGSQRLDSPWGDVEIATGGAAGVGTPVLVVHGSGGGFDQGALVARALIDDGRRWIAPSRFGYLRSALPAGAGFADQADAFAWLVERLGSGRVHVLALSHGGPSALWLALRHPARVASLTLLSAGVTALPVADQRAADRKGRMLTAIYQHDLVYWGLTKSMRRVFLGLMGVDAAVAATLTPAQRALADEVIDAMNPVAPRAAGVVFDNRAAMPDARIAGIRAPTLIVHARDDSLQLFGHAEFAAATIPGAHLAAYDRGGHLLMVVERDAVRQRVAAHWRKVG